MAPEEGVGVRWGRDGVPSEEELVVKADAEGEDVPLGDDDPVCVRLDIGESHVRVTLE